MVRETLRGWWAGDPLRFEERFGLVASVEEGALFVPSALSDGLRQLASFQISHLRPLLLQPLRFIYYLS
jgi:hypothetical protein